LIFDIYIFNLKYGNKKETFREASMHFLQKHQLPKPQIQNHGRQAGIEQILQN